MSDTADAARAGLGYSRISGRWGWFVALGVLSIVAGFVAFTDVIAFTLISVIFIGAALLVSGGFQIVHAFATKSWSQFGINVALGLLYVVGGLLIMQEPVEGSMIITLFLLIALVIGGVLRIVIALRHRELRLWWLMAIGGLGSVAIGVLLFLALPWSGLWVLGTLVGVELLIQGVTWLQFGLSLRRHHSNGHVGSSHNR